MILQDNLKRLCLNCYNYINPKEDFCSDDCMIHYSTGGIIR